MYIKLKKSSLPETQKTKASISSIEVDTSKYVDLSYSSACLVSAPGALA